MAFMAKYDLPSFLASAGVAAPSVYLMVGGYSLARLRPSLQVTFVRFPTAQARADWKAAQATIDSLTPRAGDLQIQATTARVQGRSADAAALDQQLAALQSQFQAATAAQEQAGAMDDAQPVVIGAADLPKVLNSDGSVSLAALYDYLKTLPRFADASDVLDAGQQAS